jgi:predicted amidophosphoribosyltransferase
VICLACRRLEEGSLCAGCRGGLRPAPERYVAGAGTIRAAYLHTGVARGLVHQLKYGGVLAAGRVLAEGMAPLVEAGAVLVPVPRVGWRRLRYGVDPALQLASELARLTGAAVEPLLRAPFWGRARAGGRHGHAPRFRGSGRPASGRLLLVDDVVTSGATLAAAGRLLPEVAGGLAATAAPPGRIPGPRTSPGARPGD